jgi:hypothetical protein
VGGVVRTCGSNALTDPKPHNVGANGDHTTGCTVTEWLVSCRSPSGLVEASTDTLIAEALGCLGAERRICYRTLRQ